MEEQERTPIPVTITMLLIIFGIIWAAMSLGSGCETVTKADGHQYMKCTEMVGDDWNVDYTHMPDCEKCNRGKKQ